MTKTLALEWLKIWLDLVSGQSVWTYIPDTYETSIHLIIKIHATNWRN